MTITLNGTTGITTPASTVGGSAVLTAASSLAAANLTGTVAASALPAGSVLQVVTATNSTRFVTTSTSFVADNLQASITPTSITSKILVLVSSNGNNNNTSNHSLVYTLYRGATNLGGATNGFGWVAAFGQRIEVPISIVYLDSPNTTSSTTYRTYIRTLNSASTVEKPSASLEMTETITLVEIAG
tara:strand:- start:16 stop:573 length:558 start_codon:yes stop_codon:yes gene_type:complete